MLDLLEKAKFVDREATAPEWKLVHRQSDAAVPAMRTVYERAVRSVELATPWDEVLVRLEAGRVDIEDLIPWGSVGAMALFDPWTRLLGPLFMRMGRITSRRLPVFTKQRTLVAGIFDSANQRAVTWAERNAADLVVAHTEVQRLAIREAVLSGFDRGLPPRILARDLRRLVGHTARDARAVIKRRIDLQVAGVAADRVTSQVDRFAQRLLRRRSENIARTETIKASVQGQLEGWRQNREARTLSRELVKEWIVTPDDRLCPICRPLDEVQVDVDGMFDTIVGQVSGPPAHPSCRCALGLNPRRPTPSAGQSDQEIFDLPSSAYPPVDSLAPETLGRFSSRPGEFTAERTRLHDAIRRRVFGTAQPVANPQATILGGGPATGKSTLVKRIGLPGNTVRIDVDEIRTLLPEYREGLARKVKDIAAITHEEASLISKQISRQATTGSFNILLDGTGDGSVESLTAKINGFRSGGHRVLGQYVSLDVDEAVRRATTRGLRNGRFVAEEYIRQVNKSISTTLPRAMGLFDEITLWDNNGAELIRVAVGGRGQQVRILDESAWRRFLANVGE